MPSKRSGVEASGDQAVLERVHRVRDEMRQKGMRTLPFDAFLWGVRGCIRIKGRAGQTIARRRLEELLDFCTASSRTTTSSETETRRLCTAVMEIPILARPGDRRSTDVLVGLLQHKNKHVRESACQSLGRLGGSQARVALEQLRDSGDPQVEALATDSLEFCNMIQMAYDMQSREAEDASALGSVLDYSPDVIYVCASIAVLAFALALVAWFRYAIPLVHPVLATMGLIFSVSLTIAAIWKHTSSESRNG